jgi:hypothetical protein
VIGYVKTLSPSSPPSARLGNPGRNVWRPILRFSSGSMMNISQDGTDSYGLTLIRFCIGIGDCGDLCNDFAQVKSKG